MHTYADYAVARCLSVRLSLRPSHAGIVSKRLYVFPHIFSLLLSASPTVLVFPYQTGWKYSDGAPNARGYEKNHDFRPISRFIRELMQNDCYCGRRIGNRNQAFEWYQFE